MKGYHNNIESLTIENENFRKVVYTANHMQLLLMTLLPKEEIGVETHTDNDQFFRFESGTGMCTIDGNEYPLANGDCIIIPAGSKHNIINTSSTDTLKMYTIYAPAHHKDGVVYKTKQEAEISTETFDDVTSE